MVEYTGFGLEVKTRLIKSPVKTQVQLAKQVSECTGLYIGDAYISKIFIGQRNAPKIVRAIREISDLPEQGQDTITGK